VRRTLGRALLDEFELPLFERSPLAAAIEDQSRSRDGGASVLD
jgi:hypothetical protein